MKKLEGKVALVTAATNGIGLGISLALAKEGCRVYMGARNEEKANGIIEEHKDLSLAFSYFNALENESYQGCVQKVIDEEGRIDILVNNFGTTDVKKDHDVANSEIDDFLAIVNQNLRSVFETAKAAIPQMIKQKSGSIINISSVGGLNPDMTRTAYGVSKAGVNFLTKDIAVQYAKDGIRCNAVLPGFTMTDAASKNMSEEFLQAFLTTVPLKRAGTVEDMANAVLFFATEDSSYITGQIMEVAGGFGVPTPMYSLYMMKGTKG